MKRNIKAVPEEYRSPDLEPEVNLSREPQTDQWASIARMCQNCMWYCNYRCRRHAPTLNGYPEVLRSDWCGDHKISKIYMGIL